MGRTSNVQTYKARGGRAEELEREGGARERACAWSGRTAPGRQNNWNQSNPLGTARVCVGTWRARQVGAARRGARGGAPARTRIRHHCTANGSERHARTRERDEYYDQQQERLHLGTNNTMLGTTEQGRTNNRTNNVNERTTNQRFNATWVIESELNENARERTWVGILTWESTTGKRERNCTCA